MARPKSEDPTVAVPIRLKTSALEWWTKQTKSGEKAAKTIQAALEAKADKEQKT